MERNEYPCMEGGCSRTDAEPVFTRPLSSIGKRRSSRQPKWYCSEHRRGHHRVSAVTGERVRSVGQLHRSRVVKEVKRSRVNIRSRGES